MVRITGKTPWVMPKVTFELNPTPAINMMIGKMVICGVPYKSKTRGKNFFLDVDFNPTNKPMAVPMITEPVKARANSSTMVPKAFSTPGLFIKLGKDEKTLLGGLKNMGSTQNRAPISQISTIESKKTNLIKKILPWVPISMREGISPFPNSFKLRQGHR